MSIKREVMERCKQKGGEKGSNFRRAEFVFSFSDFILFHFHIVLLNVMAEMFDKIWIYFSPPFYSHLCSLPCG